MSPEKHDHESSSTTRRLAAIAGQLGTVTSSSVQTISANFLQDALPWILVPKKMVVYGSLDGTNFEFLGEVPSKTFAEDEIPQIETLKIVFEPTKARYIKVVAVNYGKLPETHLSAGENAYIFIDEITIK